MSGWLNRMPDEANYGIDNEVVRKISSMFLMLFWNGIYLLGTLGLPFLDVWVGANFFGIGVQGTLWGTTGYVVSIVFSAVQMYFWKWVRDKRGGFRELIKNRDHIELVLLSSIVLLALIDAASDVGGVTALIYGNSEAFGVLPTHPTWYFGLFAAGMFIASIAAEPMSTTFGSQRAVLEEEYDEADEVDADGIDDEPVGAFPHQAHSGYGFEAVPAD